jgi:hypothetical protein
VGGKYRLQRPAGKGVIFNDQDHAAITFQRLGCGLLGKFDAIRKSGNSKIF